MLITEIKRRNREAGWYFFSPSTLEFFGSRVATPTWTAPGSNLTFFVTSEQRPDSDEPRLYTVRVFDATTGSVETHGEFQAYATRDAAFDAARNASLEARS